MESITWKQPATWKRFGLESQADADTTAPMAYNQGYYNLFLAVITIIGMVLIVVVDWDDAGWALLIASCGSMAAACPRAASRPVPGTPGPPPPRAPSQRSP